MLHTFLIEYVAASQPRFGISQPAHLALSNQSMGSLGFNDFLRANGRHSLRVAHLAKLNDDIYWHVVQIRKLETLNIQLWNLKQDFSQLLRRKISLESGQEVPQVEKTSLKPPYKLPKQKRYLSRKAAENCLTKLQARYFELIDKEREVNKELELFKHDIARITLKLYRLETGSGSNPSVPSRISVASSSQPSSKDTGKGDDRENRKSQLMRLTLTSSLSPNEQMLGLVPSTHCHSSFINPIGNEEQRETETPKVPSNRESNIIAVSKPSHPIVTVAPASPHSPNPKGYNLSLDIANSGGLKELPVMISEVFNSTDSGELTESVVSEEIDLLPKARVQSHKSNQALAAVDETENYRLKKIQAELQAEREAAAILDAYATDDDDWSPFDWVKIAQLAVS